VDSNEYPIFFRTAFTTRATERKVGIPDNYDSDPFSIYVRSDQQWVQIDLRQLVWLEADRHWVHLHLANGMTCRTKIPLAVFEANLPSDDFLRIHKLYMVSRRHVEACYKRRFWLKTFYLPIGRMYLSKVLLLYPTALDSKAPTNDRLTTRTPKIV
jgi:DNA-binding LytR/AlgR family response regulator